MTFQPIAPAGALPRAPGNAEKIEQAARGFEGLFLAQLLKVMKNSTGTPKEEALFASTPMTEFADMEVARVLAERRGIGLSKMLVQSLSPKEGPAPAVRTELRRAPESLPIKQEGTSLFEPLVRKAARKFNLHPELLQAVIHVESGGNPRAESPRGAKGLMQLVDSTARMLGVTDAFNPQQNIEGGARYLRQLMDRFDHKLEWALAAYNAGPGAVQRFGGIPPYRETQNYVRRVLEHFYGTREPNHGS